MDFETWFLLISMIFIGVGWGVASLLKRFRVLSNAFSNLIGSLLALPGLVILLVFMLLSSKW